jgi:ribonuclease-3
MTASLDKLQQSLGYQFVQPELLSLALTHRSTSKQNYERLEFLGDALLDFIIGEILYFRFKDATEGELSRLRARFVNKAALAGLGKELELGALLKLGAGEAKSGGKQRESILADVVEAIVAAVYLDGGLEACKAVVQRISEDMLTNPRQQAQSKDPKTRLQELLQARGLPLPVYKVLAINGEAHQQTFHVECQCEALKQATKGKGRSKRIAEQNAAERAYQVLEEENGE